jgi:hypothetical protein
MKRKSNGIKEKERGKGRGTWGRHGKTERKEKEKGKKRMGASGPLVHDFVLAITPFICILFSFISEKPLPVDVGIVGRTTSNIVFIVVLSLPQTCVSSD